MSNYLSKEELIRKLGVCGGLIPVDLNVAKRELIWRDLGQFHNYEGFFRTSLETFSQLRALGKQKEADEFYRTDLEVLESDEILTEYIYPTAFIFHAGRCGSTLLSKSIARSRANLVFGEAELQNKIWSFFTSDWQSVPIFGERERQIYKHLILAMARRRLDAHQNHVIKFTSTNILVFELIRMAFPDVPALFIYRDPSAILQSFLKKAPGWSTTTSSRLEAFVAGVDHSNIQAMSKPEFYQNAIKRFFSAAIGAEKSRTSFLNYSQLTASNLSMILNALNITATAEHLAQMQEQFEYDSKTDYKLKTHERAAPPESSESEHDFLINTELDVLYQQLVNSDRNVTE